MDKFLGFKTDEILTCLLLIVVGYVIAKMFNGCSNNGFSVGIRKKDGNTCKEGDRCYSLQDSEYAYKCPTTGICHNLVIDDGTVVPCKNPEGVVGSSNDTYCIQGGLPDPNIPVDCEGHWEDPSNCNIDCERKYVVDIPVSNGGKPCDDIGKTKCKNNLANIFTKCTTCTTDTAAEKYQLPNCVNLLPCKQLSPELCTGFSGYRCYKNPDNKKCLDKKKKNKACKIDDECVSTKCTKKICE
jgi:hypothetical protein